MINLENDLFIIRNQEVMYDMWELENKLWEMDYRDGKLKEVDDGFEIDFS